MAFHEIAFARRTRNIRDMTLRGSWPMAAALALAAFALSGCAGSGDSPLERVRQQVTGDYPTRLRTFAGDERTVFAATRTALKRMGYRIDRAGASQGYIDAASAIGPAEEPGRVHQFGIHVSLAAALDAKSTEVTARMTETLADDRNGQFGQGAETPLRDTALYEVFFRAVQGALDQPDSLAPSVASPVGR